MLMKIDSRRNTHDLQKETMVTRHITSEQEVIVTIELVPSDFVLNVHQVHWGVLEAIKEVESYQKLCDNVFKELKELIAVGMLSVRVTVNYLNGSGEYEYLKFDSHPTLTETK